MPKDMWMVRAGQGAHLFNEFKERGIVAIGWTEMGDISKVSPDKIKDLIRQTWPEFKMGKVNASAGQVSRFRFDFKKGDLVLTYNSEDRIYLVGEIAGDYEFDTKGTYHHIRKVNWQGEVSRDKLSTSTKNSLGSILTIFKPGEDVVDEIMKALKGEVATGEDDDANGEELHTIKEDVTVKAQEFIKDKIMALDWEEMQELVAGLLRAMGYKTIVSPKGADRGRDIQASPDGLGLEDPRIIVEVKHRSGQMGAKEVRSFITGAGQGSKGLYVSTGGFSKEARYEAERSVTPVTLIDIDRLVSLFVQYYDSADMDTRALVPLVKIYWPA
jgi:restriction system protein